MDQLLTEKIQGIQKDVKRRYGSPRIRMELEPLAFLQASTGSRASCARPGSWR
jgi:hypothetical protein